MSASHSIPFSHIMKYLRQHGYAIGNVFVRKKYCLWIESIHSTTLTPFLIYIPSKYKCSMDTDYPYYTLSSVDTVTLEGSLHDQYQIQKDVNVVPLERTAIPIEEYLDRTYQQPIAIKRKEKTRLQQVLFLMLKQLDRLSGSVAGSIYDLALLKDSYLVYQDQKTRRVLHCPEFQQPDLTLRVVVPIKILYDRIDSVHDEVLQVREGLLTMLRTNRVEHYKCFDQFVEKERRVATRLQNEFLHQCETYLRKYEALRERCVDDPALQADITSAMYKIQRDYSSLCLELDNVLYESLLMMHRLTHSLESIDTMVRELAR